MGKPSLTGILRQEFEMDPPRVSNETIPIKDGHREHIAGDGRVKHEINRGVEQRRLGELGALDVQHDAVLCDAAGETLREREARWGGAWGQRGVKWGGIGSIYKQLANN